MIHELPNTLRLVVVLYFLFLFAIGIATMKIF